MLASITCSLPAAAGDASAGFATWVDVEGPARGLEGDFRPGHFRGVATVCLKLFTIVRPHVAYFGQKDAQQVAVIKRLVRDLNLELAIRVIPTVRDADGLALSSRNARLSPAERTRATAIGKRACRRSRRVSRRTAIRSRPRAPRSADVEPGIASRSRRVSTDNSRSRSRRVSGRRGSSTTRRSWLSRFLRRSHGR